MMRILITALALAVFMLGTMRVHALDIGECGTMADMTAKLKAEGQQSIASGTTKAAGKGAPDNAVRTVVFSANASGSMGYTLQANDMLSLGPTQMCVYNRMTNVRVYDVRKSGPQTGVIMKSDREAGARKCKELIVAGQIDECGLLDSTLAKLQAIGERVMVQGDNVRKRPDGSYKADGIRVTVTANMSGRNEEDSEGRGSILYSTAEGATKIEWVFIETKYSDAGEKRLAAR